MMAMPMMMAMPSLAGFAALDDGVMAPPPVAVNTATPILIATGREADIISPATNTSALR